MSGAAGIPGLQAGEDVNGASARGLRVMIVTDQYEPMVGGVPTVTKELARGLSERGHTVTVVAPGTTAPGVSARPVTTRGVAGPDDWPAEGEPGRVRHDFYGSVRWPWYEGQRLGLLGKRGAAQLMGRSRPTSCTCTRR